jgi:acetoin utilization protein AcuB
MTFDATTVRPESDPMVASMVLKFRGFRHLPVVDAGGNLVGVLGRDDLERFLSSAESPGIMKRQHRVDQVMSRDVVTVSPDCPLEDAATLMLEHKIGSLPVVEAGQVVGIITETDIFRQFAAVLGGGTDSLRLTVQVADTPGQLAELAGRIAQVDGNISSIVAYAADQSERINITLRVEGASQEAVVDAVSALAELQVLDVSAP